MNEKVGTVEEDLSVSSSCSHGAERKGDSADELQEIVVENISNLLPPKPNYKFKKLSESQAAKSKLIRF